MMLRSSPASTRLPGLLSGWPLLGLLSAAIIAGALATLVIAGTSVDGVRLVIRLTARTSFVLFGLTFVASALVELAPGSFTRWLRRNRRYIGLAFAVSHGVHAVALGVFAYMDLALLQQLSGLPQFIGGGSAYLVIIAMAATSFDRTAALIGPTAWRRLHTFGAYYLWLSFLVSFGRRAVTMSAYWPVMVAIVALLVIRILAQMRRSARLGAGAASA